MPSELGEWLEEKFGTRDERLVTDPDLAAPLVAAREEVLDRLTETMSEREELRETYRESLQEADRLDRDDPQFEELLQEAKLAKRQFNRRQKDLHRYRRRLTTMLLIDTLRSFEGIPDIDMEVGTALDERFWAITDDIPELDSMDLMDQIDPALEAFAFGIERYPDMETPETPGFPGEHTGGLPGDREEEDLEEEALELEDEDFDIDSMEPPDPDDVLTDT